MKKLLFLFLIVRIAVDVRAQEQKAYELENRLWESLTPVYKESGTDLLLAEKQISRFLIEEGILNSAGAKDYLAMLQRKESPEYTSGIDSLRAKLVSFSMALELFYGNQMAKDSLFVKKSRLYKLKQQAKNRSEISIENYKEILRKNLNERDMEVPLLHFMVSITMIDLFPFNTDAETMIARPVSRAEVGKEDVLSIVLNAGDSLFCNNSMVDTMELKALVSKHIISKKDYAIVVIMYSDSSTLSYYLRIYNTVKSAFYDVRNEYALKKFGKSYKELNADQKKIINNIIPINISEVAME